MTDPTAHWSPSEVDDDGDRDRASYPPPPALDLDAIETRFHSAAKLTATGDERAGFAWRSASDVPALVARVRELEAQLSATEAEARTALDAMHKRCDAAEAEVAAAKTLVAKLGNLLRATADAIKGPPPPLSRHSTHDLPRVAAAVRGCYDALREAVCAAAASVGVPTDSPFSTAQRLASAVSLARRDAERLRAEPAAAQPVLVLDAIRRGTTRPSVCARCDAQWRERDGNCDACGHPDAAAAERFAAEHPYAAGAIMGGIAHRSEVKK